jgi:hypothetical protein
MVFHSFLKLKVHLHGCTIRQSLIRSVKIDASVLRYTDAAPDSRIQFQKFELVVSHIANEFGVTETCILQSSENFKGFVKQANRPFCYTLYGPSSRRRIGQQLPVRADPKRPAVLEQPSH